MCGFPSRRRQCYIYNTLPTGTATVDRCNVVGGRTTAYADVIFSVLSESLSLSSLCDSLCLLWSESDDFGQMNLNLRGGYATNSGNVGHLK